ncbi:MAG: FecR domain-containing protein [Alphaproteobacteria bacterium]
MTVRYALAAGLIAAGWTASAAAQENIGVAAAVENLVHGTLAEQERTLVIGDRLFHNEAIETEVESSTQLLFLDETTMSIGPESRLVLDTFVFDPDPNVSKVVMSATVGVFRFVSGSLASASYEIRTPVAVIGVRGTIFDLLVALDGATTVVLRAGALAISNLQGVTVNIDTPGLASTVAAPDAAPTPPAPSPPVGLGPVGYEAYLKWVDETFPPLPPGEIEDLTDPEPEGVPQLERDVKKEGSPP